jgi:hypothetical protein
MGLGAWLNAAFLSAHPVGSDSSGQRAYNARSAPHRGEASTGAFRSTRRGQPSVLEVYEQHSKSSRTFSRVIPVWKCGCRARGYIRKARYFDRRQRPSRSQSTWNKTAALSQGIRIALARLPVRQLHNPPRYRLLVYLLAVQHVPRLLRQRVGELHAVSSRRHARHKPAPPAPPQHLLHVLSRPHIVWMPKRLP